MYQQFILRDVVAYVAPGTILAACLLRVHLGGLEPAVNFIREDIPAIAYVPIYGLLFTMGLGIQNFGEMIKLLRDHVRKDDQQRFDKLQEFHRAVLSSQVSDQMRDEYSDVLERTRERIEIKKYAAGNIALAMVIGAILIWIAKTFPNATSWAILVIGAILAISLIRPPPSGQVCKDMGRRSDPRPQIEEQESRSSNRIGCNLVICYACSLPYLMHRLLDPKVYIRLSRVH